MAAPASHDISPGVDVEDVRVSSGLPCGFGVPGRFIPPRMATRPMLYRIPIRGLADSLT